MFRKIERFCKMAEPTLKSEIARAAMEIKDHGQLVRPKTWQAVELKGTGMVEIFNFQLRAGIPDTLSALKHQTNPDLPWADEHFAERVSGIPMNPAPSYVRWPYYKQDEKWRKDGKFSHTYPERMWAPHIDGIRYPYGNLEDVLTMLVNDPMTRQAFLPLWFPEDTGAVHGERVPCTIGYWFILRDNKLNLYYPIRSCDYRRHFKNDVYFACRLCMWVIDQLKVRSLDWASVKPGELVMHVWNLHVFEGEEKFI
jgi:hypothetical protein